ncbi:hypothetical protein [Phytohabitans houttuyneae]|uniref:Uncharacterized protein n=1 Tax=Phytohabitans houttuyneae TaxID=1076126 RepID=A0A6V8K2Z0_9ACTN|nr:hypothetical protein [Phytohabitans houttuyneae]GFJ79512.1 hypothetical protein Phou_036920 [Phytohabitans houttuyneae]
MHDPSVLLFAVPVLKLDIWHDEPGGHDATVVCGHPPQRILRRLAWALRHVRHLHFRWWRYLNVKRWIVDRCEGCGQRFRWKEARHSYQSSERAVWHDPCMSLRHVRGQLDDLTGYVLATADSNARWRATYRLEQLENAAKGEVAS